MATGRLIHPRIKNAQVCTCHNSCFTSCIKPAGASYHSLARVPDSERRQEVRRVRPPQRCDGHLRWSVRYFRNRRSHPRGTVGCGCCVAIFRPWAHTKNSCSHDTAEASCHDTPSLHHSTPVLMCVTPKVYNNAAWGDGGPDWEPRSPGHRGHR